jgi:hypothetical protein
MTDYSGDVAETGYGCFKAMVVAVIGVAAGVWCYTMLKKMDGGGPVGGILAVAIVAVLVWWRVKGEKRG